MGRNAILAVVAWPVAKDLRNNTGGNLAELEGRVPPVAAHGQASGSLQCSTHPKQQHHIIFPMLLCMSRLNNYVALLEGENGNGNHI